MKLIIELKEHDDGWVYEISSPELADYLEDDDTPTLLTRSTTSDLDDVVSSVEYDLKGMAYMVYGDKAYGPNTKEN